MKRSLSLALFAPLFFAQHSTLQATNDSPNPLTLLLVIGGSSAVAYKIYRHTIKDKNVTSAKADATGQDAAKKAAQISEELTQRVQTSEDGGSTNSNDDRAVYFWAWFKQQPTNVKKFFQSKANQVRNWKNGE